MCRVMRGVTGGCAESNIRVFGPPVKASGVLAPELNLDHLAEGLPLLTKRQYDVAEEGYERRLKGLSTLANATHPTKSPDYLAYKIP